MLWATPSIQQGPGVRTTRSGEASDAVGAAAIGFCGKKLRSSEVRGATHFGLPSSLGSPGRAKKPGGQTKA
eukprot:symbB.v1.2.004232.t1/scaffold221.1/size262466/16